MEDTNKIQRLEEKIDTLEATLAYQTEMLEAQAARDRKRKIWFFVKLGIVVAAMAILIPKGAALYQQTETFFQQTEKQIADLNQEVSVFLDETGDEIGTIADAMETMQKIVAPMEEFLSRWRLAR